MKREWLVEAGVIAGVFAPLYFIAELVLGSAAGPAALRSLFLFVVVGAAALFSAAGRERRAQRKDQPPSEPRP